MDNSAHLSLRAFSERMPRAVSQAPSASLPKPQSGIDLRDRFQGCLLGVAIGDALGRPGEGRPFEVTVRRRGGPLREYIPWRGWKTGPIGTITDDTQMTMCIAESIAANAGVDCADIGTRFAQWLDYGRGKGRTCVEACESLRDGAPWYESGVESAGNGAAMRTAPIGLLHCRDVVSLRVDAALVAAITHADPTAIASAIAQSAGIAFCLTQTAESFKPDEFVAFVKRMIDGVEEHDIPERRPDGSETTLAKQIAKLPGLLDEADVRAVYDQLYNGAFVLESLPTSFYAFLRNFRSFDEAVHAGVDAGYDCDTSGSMAAAVAGALIGRSGIDVRWLDELEFRDDLIRLADQIHHVAVER